MLFDRLGKGFIFCLIDLLRGFFCLVDRVRGFQSCLID